MIITIPDPACPACKKIFTQEFQDGAKYLCPFCGKKFWAELNYDSYSYWVLEPVKEEE